MSHLLSALFCECSIILVEPSPLLSSLQDEALLHERSRLTWSVMLLMLLGSMPEICTLGHTRLVGVSWSWMPSRVVSPSGRDTVRSPAAEGREEKAVFRAR